MKLLWNNYLEDSTVTASSEDASYPASNLTHKFLEKKFQALGSQSTVTITMPETRTVSMIAYGFNNTTTAQDVIVITKDAADTFVITKDAADTVVITVQAFFELKNSVGTVVYSGQLETGADINVNHFTPTECKTIEISFASSNAETLYVGGLSVGDPLEIEYIRNNPTLAHTLRGTANKTEGGQLLSKKVRHLVIWDFSIPLVTNSKRAEITEMIDECGNYKPIFASLYEDADIEPSIYCNIISGGEFPRINHKNEFTTDMTLEECR